MRENEKLVPCPIARSSNNDAYNDVCSATGRQCPYFGDEGMSVCKSKLKCVRYFSKRSGKVKLKKVITLIFSDTKSVKAENRHYTNTIKHSRRKHHDETKPAAVEPNDFMDELQDALKNHGETRTDDAQKGKIAGYGMSAIENYKKKM